MSLTLDRPTSLGLSALLHAAFLAVGFLGALFAGRGEEIVVTPVTLVGPEMLVDPGYAVKAEVVEEAMTEDPLKILPPEPVAETPSPEPLPAPKSPPAPKQAATPRSPPAAAPKANAPAPKAPSPAFNTRALEAELAAASRSAGQQRSGGRQGPTQSQRATEELLSEGEAARATTDALNAIAAKIERNWRINCANTGERNARVTLRIELDRRGGLVRSEVVGFRDLETIRDPGLRTAATLALSAARAAAPFEGLPEQTFGEWRSKTYEFRGDEACEARER